MKTIVEYLSKFIFTFTFIFFFYGMFNYPDTPIRPCLEDKYCGKFGKFYTVADYENYQLWQAVNMVSFPVAFFFLFVNKKYKKDTRKQ